MTPSFHHARINILYSVFCCLLIAFICLSAPQQAQAQSRTTSSQSFMQAQAPPGMLLVSGGEFIMGDQYGVGLPHESPIHAVYVDSFYMDIYEVTNQQYCDFLNWAFIRGRIEVWSGIVYKTDTSYAYCGTYSWSTMSRIHWNGGLFTVTSGKEDHPMLQVSWHGAAAYANYRSLLDGLPLSYDLLEWECSGAASDRSKRWNGWMK